MKINTQEHVRTILGVEGRAFARHVWPAGTRPERAVGLWASQTWAATREYREGGQRFRITAKLRFDDDCKNGHHTFAITGEVWSGPRTRDERNLVAAGCVHEDIAERFPELAPLLKWHLTSTDGPMHYPSNVLYHAGNRDHWGLAPGEASRWETFLYFGDSPVGHAVDNDFGDWIKERLKPVSLGADVYRLSGDCLPFEVRPYTYDKDPKTYGAHYTLALAGSEDIYSTSKAAPAWHTCPFREAIKADQFAMALNTCRVRIAKTPVEFSKGKARLLDNARSAAVWPEATDAELTQEPEALKAALMARLPGLMAEFRRAMVEDCGFAWEVPK